MPSIRSLGFTLLIVAVALTVWGLFRQVDPGEHPVTFGTYILAILLASIAGFVLSAD